MNKQINVTKPYLPPLEEYIPLLEEIWKNGVLTNGGPFHQGLENKLCEYLGVKNISLFTNATVALVTALQALGIKGEVITTPYSFVATAHSILWNGLKPIFVDIDADTLNLDPKKIEAAITSDTTAIMPVHCYGHPCDVDAIAEIAKKNNLKIIYDAAHAFGVKCHCGSILNHGDLSILSFHATKVFNTFEGGAIVSSEKSMKIRIDQLKNFGFEGETSVVESGINGKMSELNAAFGLVQLRHIDEVIDRRGEIDSIYRKELKNTPGIRLLKNPEGIRSNFSYFPVMVEKEYGRSRDELYEVLKYNKVFARRYFYPLITDFSMYKSLASAGPENLPVATEVAKKIICLPIYPELTNEECLLITRIISSANI